MYAYIIRRVWQMIPTILGVILLVFLLFNWIGGDPAYVLAGKISSAEQIANIRRQLGVDQPYYVQLWIFIKQVLTADFGASWSTNEAVSHIMATRLGPSLTLLIPWLILSTLISIGLALAVAYVRGSLTDRAVMISCTVGPSISIITHVMATLPGLLIGAFLVERFFSIPGIGREVILAVERSDFPVIKAITVYVAVATMIFNLLADLMYKAVDPRVQLK